jgi:hypothetical protein
LPTPFRKFQSAPTIEFEIKEIRQQVAMPPESVDVDSKINAFILTDINILNDQGILVRPRDESPLRAAVDTESGREYQTLVTRDPRRGEEIDPGRIVKDIEDTKI